MNSTDNLLIITSLKMKRGSYSSQMDSYNKNNELIIWPLAMFLLCHMRNDSWWVETRGFQSLK